MSFPVETVETKPFEGQKPGTSGLRKRVKVFQQKHYTENFVQAIFDSIDAKGATLVIGGDGRYFSEEAVQIILKVGSANGVAEFIIGQDGILSTPAASNVIRKYKAYGGILLTASHNPGGPDNDFGIKYNVGNGGPAPENVTDKMYEKTKTISQYKIIKADPVDLSKIGPAKYANSKVTIIDSVKDYLELMESIFDFPLIKSFLSSHSEDFRVLFDGLHGVTGPYAKGIFLGAFGLPEASVQNCVPLPDFGGGHPDPNLTYAHSLVDAVEKNGIQFGAASDGDGDRNMIYGKGAFVTPSDSVAIIADWAESIPYFKKGGVKGLARSMPTSKAIDLVAQKKGLEYFEVPTGWKFFGNLMDAGRLSICGEESFGTGSDHIREKDGIWAVVAWLNILAAANAESPNKLIGINELLQRHYSIYGRSFFSRYDYEEVPSDGAQSMVDHINALGKSDSFAKSSYSSKSTGTEFTVSGMYNFEYKDPIDHSVSKNQGQVITFSDGSRVVFRLSGTGSQGATVRMYVERYVAADAGEAELKKEASEGLKGLIEVALEISKMKDFLGREKPTVITAMSSPRPSVKVTYMGRQKKKTVVQEEVDESVSETEIETQQSDHGLEHKASAASLKGKVKKGGSSSSKGTPVKKIDFKRPDPPTRLKRPDMTPLKRPDMTPAGSKDSITVRPSTSISSASELLKRAPSSSPSSSAKKPASVRSTKSSSKRQVPPSESEQDDAGSIADSFFSSQRIRRTEDERLEYYKNQPECDQNRIDPHSVVCLKCNRTVKLGTRTTYTVKPWEAHRSKCDTPKDPSEPQTIRRTVEERKALLETDTRAAQIKPDEVLCARCNKWIQLLKTQDYSLSNWNKHQSTCSEAVPSDRVSSAERKLKILNDPQQKDYGPRHVSCKICDVEVMLEGPGDYELESWELHKSTCHPPSDTPAEEPVPAADVSVTSTEETAVDPPGSVAATLSAPRGLKRARSEEEEAIAVDDDNHQEESRPSNRQRDDSYEPTEGVGLFGLLKIPWKAFLDGWNLRKNKAISESLN